MGTSDALVAAIRRRTSCPTHRLTAQEICDFATAEIRELVVPLIREERGDLMVRTEEVAFSASQTHYPVPSRAQGAQFRTVEVVGTNGARILPQLLAEDADAFAGSTASVDGYYFEGDSIVITPRAYPSATAIRFRYYWRHGALVPVASARAITVVSSAPSYTVASAIPGTWSTSTPLDVIRGRSPFALVATVTPSTASSTTVAFATTPDPAPLVGDWLALEGETPVVQLPEDLVPLVESATAVRVLEAIGDMAALAAAAAMVERAIGAARAYLSPRQDGRLPRLVNRSSMLRRRTSWRSV